MNAPQSPADRSLEQAKQELADASKGTLDALDVKSSEGLSEKIVDAIEMIGEESAGALPDKPSEISPALRYLHCSRTIHQLVTDRNRAVGIFLAVASLLMTASGAITNAKPEGNLIIPVQEIQRWCLPITFGVLTVLAILMDLLLVRTRVGLIYEVAKMNALLGLPIGRVSRLSPLSIFFILQMIISLAGGLSAALLSVHLIRLANPDGSHAGWLAFGVGVVVSAGLTAMYAFSVVKATSDETLQKLGPADHAPRKSK